MHKTDGIRVDRKILPLAGAIQYVGRPMIMAPSSITVSGFKANWGSVNGASGYRLDVAVAQSFAGNYVAGYDNKDMSMGTSALITGLNPGTAYYYRVRSYDSEGHTSANSEIKTVWTIPASPVLAANANISDTGFTISWGTVTGALRYYVDVSTDSGFVSIVSEGIVTGATQMVITKLSPHTNYWYRVMAGNSSGKGVGATGTCTTYPGIPVAGDASNVTLNGYTANWSDTGAELYSLDISLSSAFVDEEQNWIKHNQLIPRDLSYAVAVNDPGQTHYYRVRSAVDLTGGAYWYGGYSDTKTAAIPLAAPVISSPSGEYDNDELTAVIITCPVAGCDIHYTLDGSAPTSASQIYTEPLSVYGNTQLRAVATKGGSADSAIVVRDYVVNMLIGVNPHGLGTSNGYIQIGTKAPVTLTIENGSFMVDGVARPQCTTQTKESYSSGTLTEQYYETVEIQSVGTSTNTVIKIPDGYNAVHFLRKVHVDNGILLDLGYNAPLPASIRVFELSADGSGSGDGWISPDNYQLPVGIRHLHLDSGNGISWTAPINYKLPEHMVHLCLANSELINLSTDYAFPAGLTCLRIYNASSVDWRGWGTQTFTCARRILTENNMSVWSNNITVPTTAATQSFIDSVTAIALRTEEPQSLYFYETDSDENIDYSALQGLGYTVYMGQSL